MKNGIARALAVAAAAGLALACASGPVQGRHLDYHWDGKRVDLFREPGSGIVYRIT